MHLRKLTFTVGLVGALCSTWAYSLGLGEIKLNSTLNQPLDAEIKLLQVRNLTEEDILVSLAKGEDFQRFGVDRIFFLQNLKFDVQLDNPAGPVVRVTTDEPVREPYLIFLLEAESPQGGRLLREYTLLLDLPVFADQPAQPVQGAQTRPAQAAQTPAPASRPAPAPQPAQQAGEPPRAQPAPARSVASRPGVEVYGPVQPNDTLWEIAERVRPNNSVSVQQSMLALQRANPEAFIDGNINLLKRGQVLRIPSESEFATVDRTTAVTEVAVQNERWSAARRGEPTGAELQASSSRPSVANQAQAPRGQLTIAAPGVTDRAGERSGAGDDAANVEALENELALSADQLDATRRENEELSARVAELEEQIATMERLVEVSNEELRAMQLAAEQGQQAEAAEQPAPAQPVEAQPAAAEAEPALAEPAEEPAPQPVAQPERMVVTQSVPQPTLVDQLMANLWYLLGGLFAIFGGVGYLLHRRKQQEEEAQVYEAALDENMFADEQASYPEESDDFDNLDFGEAMELGDDEPEAVEESPEAMESVEPETGDAVGEADIYIAYGKYDQAEEMLQKAIAREPENVDARLKLLEVYSETRNAEKFDREYGQLMAMGDAAATARAGELRNAIPGVEDYSGEVPTAGVQADDAADQGFDLADDDFSFDTADDARAPEGDSSQAADAGQEGESDFADLSLDLDLDTDGESESEVFDLDLSTEPRESHDDEKSFDFNLDLEGEDLDSKDLDSKDLGAGEEPELAGEGEGSIEFDTRPSAEKADDDFDFSAFELDFAGEEGEEKVEAESDGLAFDLDLDSSTGSAAEADAANKGDDSDPLEDLDFADLELEESESNDGQELGLDLDLDEEFSLESATDTTASAEAEQDLDGDDIFSDLEFTADDDNEQPAATGDASELDDLEFSTSLGEAGKQGETEEADDFDLDMGDLDLQALDQEMDALVGEVDDLGDDDDVAVATPTRSSTETLPALDEKLEVAAAPAAKDEIEFDLDDLMAGDLDNAELESETLESEDWSLEDVAPARDKEGEAELEAFAFGEDQSFDEEETDDLASELDFLSDADEVATKLDLARAYIDMGDQDGARDILDEVKNEGNEDQKREAAELLGKIN